MSLRDDMTRDIGDSFLRGDEFAEPRMVSHKSIMCVFYSEQGTPADEEHVAEMRYVLHARTSDLPPHRVGDRLTVDGKSYIIVSARADYGMSELKLTLYA